MRYEIACVPDLCQSGNERCGQRECVCGNAALEERYRDTSYCDLDVRRSSYFPSGSNHAGDIKGLALSGCHIGATVSELNDEAIAEIALCACTGTRIFLDSGAFSEVDRDDIFKVVAPIADAEWRRRLGVYLLLSIELGEQLYIVAPDRVADQDETLRRLKLYRRQVGLCRVAYANVIVPIQRGRMSMRDFAASAAEALGFDDFIPGIPSKKHATPLPELAAFLEAARPQRLHLLGLGPMSPRYPAVMQAATKIVPRENVTCDSARIRQLVGWGVDGETPRALTAANAALEADGVERSTTERKYRALQRVMLDQYDEQLRDARLLGWRDPELDEEKCA